MEAGISVSIQALAVSDRHKREYLPASQRQTHLLATCTLKLVRRDAAFLITSLYLPPSPSNLREKQLSEKIWKSARRVLDETPRVVPVLLLDANGHISQTTWPEQIGKYIQWPLLDFCKIITCGRRTLTFLWERLSLDPSPTLRSTLRVFLILFMFTDVADCTTTEIDCNWQQLRGEGSSSHSVCLSTSAYIWNT